MKRLILGTSLLVIWGSACVSHRAVRSRVSSHRVRRTPTSRPSIARTPPTHAAPSPKPQYGYAAAWFPRTRPISSRWTYIVIHHSATASGGAKQFDRYHRQHNGWDELGYHFVIGNGTDTPDGFVEVGPRWQKQKHGAHCKTPDNYYNEHGIGICLVGDFTRTRPTARQWTSLISLVRFLSQQRGIPPERIVGHGEISSHTQCPGRYFDLDAFRRAVANSPTASVVP